MSAADDQGVLTMLFPNRSHGLARVSTAAELAERLTQHDWTPCTAFLLGDVLYANDSTGPDGAQEYAVIEVGELGDTAVRGIQFESVTFGWIAEPRALELIEEYADPVRREALKGQFGSPVGFPLHAPGETCGHCV